LLADQPTLHRWDSLLTLLVRCPTVRELTLIEFDIFSKVTPRELLSYCWKAQAENIKAIIARFNEVPPFTISVLAPTHSRASLDRLTHRTRLLVCVCPRCPTGWRPPFFSASPKSNSRCSRSSSR
jgi:hypothetical protein